MLKGIDVSYHNKTIDWEKVKKNIDFAILRCGYGKDFTSQDDKQWKRNVTECERLNIPFGVYLYSYATNEAAIDSEVAHTLRLIGSHKPFCVYIDMEDVSTDHLGKETLTAFAKRYCEAVKAKGFKVGVYANQNWFKNYLDVKALHNAGYSIWCARYGEEEPKIAADFDIWQYTSSGSVDGITTRVDMNYMYNDIREIKVEAKKTAEEIAEEVLKGKWGNGKEREKRLTAAGYNYKEIQAIVNKKAASSVSYFKKYTGETRSIVSALQSIGEKSSFAYRLKIAKANGIKVYAGTASQNTKLLTLLKQGKLIKP